MHQFTSIDSMKQWIKQEILECFWKNEVQSQPKDGEFVNNHELFSDGTIKLHHRLQDFNSNQTLI